MGDPWHYYVRGDEHHPDRTDGWVVVMVGSRVGHQGGRVLVFFVGGRHPERAGISWVGTGDDVPQRRHGLCS